MGCLDVFKFNAATPFDLLAAAFKSRLVPLLILDIDSLPSVTFLLWLDLLREGEADCTDLPDPTEVMGFLTAPPGVRELLF